MKRVRPYLFNISMLLALAGCAEPREMCDLVIGPTQYDSYTGKCPTGMALVGVQNNVLTCAQVQVACPPRK